MTDRKKRSEEAQKKNDRLRSSMMLSSDSTSSMQAAKPSSFKAPKLPGSASPSVPPINSEQLALIPDILDTTIEAIRAMEKAEEDNEYTRACNNTTRDEMKQTRDEGQARERRIYMFNGLTVLAMLVMTIGLWLRVGKLLDVMEDIHAPTGNPVAIGAPAGN